MNAGREIFELKCVGGRCYYYVDANVWNQSFCFEDTINQKLPTALWELMQQSKMYLSVDEIDEVEI